MSDLLSIGRSGVLAYQTALSTVGENVANAQTDGYARRIVTLKEVTSGGTDPLSRAQLGMNGVTAAGVQRAWDDYKAAETRTDNGDYGRTDARSRWLATTETALDDSATGVGQQLTAVFNAADALAANPASTATRQQFLLSLDSAAGSFRTTASALTDAATGVATEAGTAADAINTDLTALAKTNRDLLRAAPGSSAAADAADERDRLLDDLSSKIGVNVSLDSNTGVAKVTVGDATGQVLLDGVNAASVSVIHAADGRLSYLLNTPDNGVQALTPTGGALAGLSDVSGTIADRRATLDTLASGFATTMNNWSAAGKDTTGAAGQPLLSLGANGAATIAVTAVTADGVAAANGSAVNGNALALSSLRTSSGLEAGWATMISTQSQITAAAKSEASASSTRKDAAFAARDDVSGIDLDSEAADLLRFQQAYSASAKVIQAARETLQNILDLF